MNKPIVKSKLDQLLEESAAGERGRPRPDDSDHPGSTENACTASGAEDPDAGAELERVDAGADVGDGDVEILAKPPRRRLIRRVLAVLCGAVLVALLFGAGYMSWRYRELAETQAAGQAALATARDYAVTLTSVDSANIDDNTAKVLDGATGEFKDMYTRSSAQLRQLLIDNKAVAKGAVLDAGIKSATKTEVDVLLFVDQSVTNSTNPQPRLDRNRVAMKMKLVDGRWLAEKVDVF